MENDRPPPRPRAPEEGLQPRHAGAPADLHARGRPRLPGQPHRRRRRAERGRQDDAVRDDHRLERADRWPRARRRGRHPPGQVPRARPAGDPLPPVLPGALLCEARPLGAARAVADEKTGAAPLRRAAVQHPGRLHRLHARLLPQAARGGQARLRLPAPERALPPRDPEGDRRELPPRPWRTRHREGELLRARRRRAGADLSRPRHDRRRRGAGVTAMDAPAPITPKLDFAAELTGLFDLSGKTAFVPGGTGGLGEAIAWGLGLAGASVVIAGRERAKAERLAGAIEAGAEGAGAGGAVGGTDTRPDQGPAPPGPERRRGGGNPVHPRRLP